MWTLILTMSCVMSAQRVGIVSVSDDRVRITDPSGRSFRLIPTDSSPELVYLDGLEIRVEGRRMGRRILTREWTITDAGDGSAPFVGTLSFVQGEWMLDDRNASTPLILESQDSEALFPYIGQRILVSGFVVANQTVQIVSWRPLTDVRSLEP